MATRRLEVEITGDASSLQRALGKTQDQSNSLAKTMGKAGLAGAAIGVGVAVKAGFSEFMEAQRVTAQTNAVLKSTGNVANTTTEKVQGLSESLMRKSGVDDEAIQSGANLLLTFTKVRNEAGKGNDIFDQATKATLDLSVAMGKDMSSSAILVGKALNDPIKGMGALARAGVQFDEAQKTAIKTMVATGDTAGAQKMILKELETQFGGSAEAAGNTFSGQLNIAKESLLNLAGDGVAKAIPALQSFAGFINETVIPLLKRLHGWIQDNLVPIFRKLKEIVVDTWAAIAAVLKEHEPEIKRIIGAVTSIAEALGNMWLWIANEVIIPVLKPLFEKVLPVAIAVLITALDKWFTALGKVKDGLLWLKDNGGEAISTVWSAVKGPLGKMRDAFQSVWGVVENIIDGLKWLRDNAGRLIPNISGGMDPGPGSSGGRFGDADLTGGFNLMGADASMAPFAAQAAAFGLRVSSGLRPGAVTRHGTPSDHGIGKALDLVGSAQQMAAYFLSLVGNRFVKQAFYDPLGSIFAGLRSSYREGGHSDHVHVATYDDAMRRSRWLMPGLNLAYNGTGRPEPVGVAGGFGRGAVVNVYVSGNVTSERDLARTVRDEIVRAGRSNGGGMFGNQA